MSAELAGAVLDFGFLISFWAPGILLAQTLGQKNTWLSLTVGFLLSTAVVVALFHVTAVFEATSSWWMISKVVLLLLIITTGWVAVKTRNRAIVSPLAIALAISAIAVIARNLLRLDGRFRGPDQFLVGWVSSLAQSGHDPSHFGGSGYIARGLALPLLLAQGRQGQLLLSITIVLLFLALISTFQLATAIGTQWDSFGISLGVALVILWLTTPIVWGMAFFLNGHVLMALAVGTLATQTVARSPSVARTPVELVTIFVAGFIIASSRPEGVVLALILAFPMFITPALETGRQAAGRLAAVLGAPLGFVTWFVTTNFFTVSPVVTFIVSAFLIVAVATVFFAIRSQPSWFATVVTITGVGILAIALLQLLGSPPSLNTLTTFAANSFLGAGFWGITPWLFVGVVTLHALIRTDQRINSLVFLTAFAVVFTIAVKIVDGLVMIGGIPGLSLGWFDSVNRSFFHLIALPSALFLRLGALATQPDNREVRSGSAS